MIALHQKICNHLVTFTRPLYIKSASLLNVRHSHNLTFDRFSWITKFAPTTVYLRKTVIELTMANNGSLEITTSQSGRGRGGAGNRTVTYNNNGGPGGPNAQQNMNANTNRKRPDRVVYSAHGNNNNTNFGQGQQGYPGGGRGPRSRGDGGYSGQGGNWSGQNSRGWQENYTQDGQHGQGAYRGGYHDREYRGRGRAEPYPSSYSGGASNRHNNEEDLYHLSKSLSWILRHAAEKCGLKFMPGGFLYVDDILKLPRFKNFRIEDVKKVVAENDKQRFALEPDQANNRWKIRANQGHTVSVEGLALTPITLENADDYPVVIHGTYWNNWETIKTQGLKRMSRNHIHFAPGEPKQDGVISGMRQSCEVLIFLDLKAALKGGLKFFVSSNQVILTEGDKDGCIYPCYFDGVRQRNPRYNIPFDKNVKSKVVTAADVASEVDGQKKKKKKKKKGKGKGDDEAGEADAEQMSSSGKRDNSAQENETSEEGRSSERGEGGIADLELQENWDDEIENGKRDNAKENQATEEVSSGNMGEEGIEDMFEPNENWDDEIANSGSNKDTDKPKEKPAENLAAKTEECVKVNEKPGNITEEDMEVSGDQEPSTDQRTKTETTDEAQNYSVFNYIESKKKCAEILQAVNEMGVDNKMFMAVTCLPQSEPGNEIDLICICDAHFNIYVFDIAKSPEMIQDNGPLFELLQNSPLTRVFHNRSFTWKKLNEKFMMCPSCMPLFDIQIAYKDLAETESLDPRMSTDLTAIAKQLNLSIPEPSPDEDRIDDRDWSARPLTKDIESNIASTLKTLLNVYQTLNDRIGENLKKLKPKFYESIKEDINTEESHKLCKERKEAKKKASKKDPNIHCKKTAPKGKDKGKKKHGNRN